MFTKRKRITLSILILITLFGFILRAYRLDSIPPGLHGDEGEFGLFLNRVSQGKYPSIFNAVDTGFFNFSVASFLPQLFIKQFFTDPIIGVRAHSVLFATLSIFCFFFLSSLFFNTKTSLLITFSLATSHLFIHYGRFACNVIYPPFFAIITIYFFLKAWESNKSRFFLLAGICMGLGLYSYNPYKIIPLVLFLFLLVKRKNIIKGLSMFSVAILIFLPQLAYYLQNQEAFISRPKSILVSDFSSISANLLKNFLVIIFGIDDGFRLYGIKHFGLLSPVMAIVFIVGLVISFRRLFQDKWQLIYAIIISTIISVSFTTASPSSYRLLVMFPFLLLITGFVYQELQKHYRGLLLAVILFSIGFINMLLDYHIYFKYYINSNDGWAQYEPATEIASYLRNLGKNWYVYMLRENTILYFHHGAVQYLNPRIVGEDVDESDMVIPAKTTFKNFVYIMPPYSPSLPKLQAIYPHGRLREFYNPRSHTAWFTSYEVSL